MRRSLVGLRELPRQVEAVLVAELDVDEDDVGPERLRPPRAPRRSWSRRRRR